MLISLHFMRLFFYALLVFCGFETLLFSYFALKERFSRITSSDAADEAVQRKKNKPNIVLIMADDHGWNDVDWHDSSLHTPVLNNLAHSRHTVQLDQYYVNQVCSPTRSALLSGYYPFHLGTGNGWFQYLEPSGVPLQYLFFPEKLTTLGYNTYMVGKWHLGYCKYDYLPTRRGFEKFRGFYGGSEDYYTHSLSRDYGEIKASGMDYVRDTTSSFSADWASKGKYSTDLYVNESIALLQGQSKEKPFFLYLSFQAVHGPLQVPEEHITSTPCARITEKSRRIFCGMLGAMDMAIGKLVAELKALELYNNTIIIFTSDNGGQTTVGGNNYPLRGNKNTLWEGGTRVNCFVHAPAHISAFGVRKQMMNVIDWYATVLAMAGEKLDTYGDGINQWPMITKNTAKHNRHRFVYNIDITTGTAAIRDRNFKLIIGDPGEPSGWISSNNRNLSVRSPLSNQTLWLFNVKNDPNEKRDLSKQHPRIVNRMLVQIRKLALTAAPDVHKPVDDRGNPKYFNGTFASGWC